jgi:hypothetical protein
MKTLFIFICLCSTLHAIAQGNHDYINRKKYRHLSLDFNGGSIMQTTDFVRGENALGRPMEHYQSYGIRWLWQNPGYKHWQNVFKAPYYGFGLTLNNFFNQPEVGYPVSAYGIFGIPVKRWNKFQLYSEFQFGMAAGWKHYEASKNNNNLAIGSVLTVHVTAGITTNYQLSKSLDVGVGAHFVHFSNGGMERPNRGMNILSSSVKMNYHFQVRPDVQQLTTPMPAQRSRSLLLMLGYGNHQLVEHELDTNYFAIGGMSAIYLEQLSQAFRLGLGADFNYWWGLNANPDGTIAPREVENLTLGFIIQPEVIVDRLTLVGGIGIYARHRNYGNFNQLYQRLGVRYDFYKNLSFGMNVRSINFMLAEFLEFNLAYRIDWKK